MKLQGKIKKIDGLVSKLETEVKDICSQTPKKDSSKTKKSKNKNSKVAVT